MYEAPKYKSLKYIRAITSVPTRTYVRVISYGIFVLEINILLRL